MMLEIGLVCGNCDGYSAMGASNCALCGQSLAISLGLGLGLGLADADADADADGTSAEAKIPSAPPTSPEFAAPSPDPPQFAPAPGAYGSGASIPPSSGPASGPLSGPSSGPTSGPSSGPTIARPNLAPRATDTVIDSASPLFSEAMRPRRMTPGAVAAQRTPFAPMTPGPASAANALRPASPSNPGAQAGAGFPDEPSTNVTHAVPPAAAVAPVVPVIPVAADSRPVRSGASVPRPSGAFAAGVAPSARPGTGIRAPQPSSPGIGSSGTGYSSQPSSASQPAHTSQSAQHAAIAGARGPSLEELMEQAKNFVCRSCSTPVPVGHKFCGRCGAPVPPDILAARTQFFGQLQAPGKAKLILIRGEGVEGLSYQLNAEQHVVGKNGQLVFPDDPFVSPKHANLFYRNQKLVVRDEGSLNGVFLRVRGGIEIQPADQFLAGEQLFRVDATPKFNDGPAPDGTYFYSSPKHQTPFRVSQILQGGANGMVVCARQAGIQIGREGGDMNFPGDLYMSASHCKVDEAGGKLTLTDLNSRNGTYIRLKGERELGHGDYLFIGKKLLRVEITAA